MNYLAHLHLAEPTPASRMGNFLGEFVRGFPWDDRYPVEIWNGIMEHRYLDVFTDQHPAWRQSRERLKLENRRYAGIVIDIFYDYFLTHHWERFNPGQPIKPYVRGLHKDLKSQRVHIPRESRCVFSRMLRQKWLLSYGDVSGVAAALQRVATAYPKLKLVTGMESELIANREGFEADFLAFYPDAIAQAEVVRNTIIPARHATDFNR